jgi:YHS domain-containing protein
MDESRTVSCPICGKQVDTLRARAVGIYAGVTQYFCSADCKSKYADPRKALRPSNNQPEPVKEAEPPVRPAAPVVRDAPHKAAKQAREEALTIEAEPEEQPKKIKKDPSPSIEEDAEAWKGGGGGKVWAVVLMLFAAAGVVLYFAFVKK